MNRGRDFANEGEVSQFFHKGKASSHRVSYNSTNKHMHVHWFQPPSLHPAKRHEKTVLLTRSIKSQYSCFSGNLYGTRPTFYVVWVTVYKPFCIICYFPERFLYKLNHSPHCAYTLLIVVHVVPIHYTILTLLHTNVK
jgi:hypothetical protein